MGSLSGGTAGVTNGHVAECVYRKRYIFRPADPRGTPMHRRKSNASSFLPALLAALAVTACDTETVGLDDSGQVLGETGTTIRVLLTDAPVDYIKAAEVDIGLVELVPADDGPHVLLAEDGSDGFVNLLDFQEGATTPIAEAEIDPGSFVQLRLVVEAARVTLADGYEFRGGGTSMDLKVPSGAQTGIKLNLQDENGDPLAIVPGETVLVLDFDVSRSFVLLGNPDTPAGVHGVNFKPTIRVTGMDVAASISGVVSTAVGGFSVEGLLVTAEPTDGGTAPGYQTQAGTALTGEDGSYTIYFLVPGSYDVTVELDPGFATDPAVQSVQLDHSENETGVDFEVLDIRGSISGTVSTALTGVSVEGLNVTATPGAGGMEPVTSQTAADGTYVIDLLVPGSYVVTVEVGEDQVTEPMEAEVEVGASEDVTGVDFAIVEDVRGTISGTVSTSLGGFAVGGLTVTATPAATGVEPVTAETNTDGTYTIEFVVPGTYTVTVDVGTGFTTDPASLTVEVSDNENETGANFAVIEASGQ